MDKIEMSEPTARFTFTAGCGLSMFAAMASMLLASQGSRPQAALFLFFSFVGSTVTIVAYRRYTKLRNARWKLELKASEDALNQVLNHARMNIIVDHVTGPLHGSLAEEGAVQGADPPDGRSVAKP